MFQRRLAADRGHAQHGWLDSWHTFSFADYYDAEHMGFRALRVINDDTVAPGQGFGRHPHRDMEIVSYVLEGSLEHKDSMGTGSVIVPHDVQRMSAGTGVTHSEYNASRTEPVHFLQIWLLPKQRGIAPGYEQKRFSPEEKRAKLRVIAAPDGRDGAVTIHSDAVVYAGIFRENESFELALAPGRHAWVHVAKGSVWVQGQALTAGDALAMTDEKSVRIEGVEGAEAEVLVFDLG
jgi:redox-sensitive bicupin YhaK (pirin superfamily)